MSIETNTTSATNRCGVRRPASLRERGRRVRRWCSRLLAAGADPATWANMPLGSASFNGHAKVVKLLLESGADVHAMDDLMDAVDGHPEVVKILTDWES